MPTRHHDPPPYSGGGIGAIKAGTYSMPSASDLSIRPATRPEFDTVVDWAADEGWNPGLADGEIFHATGPQGFFIGWLEGEPVCAISVVAYGAAFGFLGFYIVKPEHRGLGYGFRIWQAGMARLAGRTVGLDGVVDQQANYRKSGFVLAHRNIRFGGTVVTEPAAVSGEITDAAGPAFGTLAACDAPFFAAPRSEFLARWLSAAEHVAKVLLRGDRVAGYGVMRPCRDGYKIGPLFADDADAADDLFRVLATCAVDGPVYLDAPEPNEDAVALARRYGLAPCFETARMYAGPAPDLPLGRIYGITTFELG